MKQLTVAVPSYNSEAFLDICLSSFIYQDGSVDERLEVLIINDGSTDSTVAVANEWVSKYPDTFVLINKENGGHGSGINAGIDHARGRYYKVVDSDDWVVTASIKELLDALEHTDADAVVTGYHTVNISSGVTLSYSAGCNDKAQEGSLEEFMKDYESAPAAQSFHGLMYNTAFYRNTGIRMSEKLFFEDQEYAILPFAHVKTILRLPCFFYEYRIGSTGQSVDFTNQAKRAGQFLKVVKKMCSYHRTVEAKMSEGRLDDAQEQFLIRRLSNAAVSYMATVLIKNNDKKQGRADAAEFSVYLKKTEYQIYARTKKKYDAMRALSYMPCAAKLYSGLFNSAVYGRFKKIWTK